jgi:hypothetical protein
MKRRLCAYLPAPANRSIEALFRTAKAVALR